MCYGVVLFCVVLCCVVWCCVVSCVMLCCVVLCCVVCVVVVVVCVVVVVVCGVCGGGTLKTPVCRFKTPPCVHSQRPRERRHHAYMLKHSVRGASFHGDVLSAHTEAEKGEGGGRRQFCLPRKAHVQFSLGPRGSHKKPLDLKHFFSWRVDRQQHVPASSNHSLCLINLFNSSSPEGHCGGNQLPDGSVCLSPPKPKNHERFARQTLSMMFCLKPLTFHNGFMFFCYISFF